MKITHLLVLTALKEYYKKHNLKMQQEYIKITTFSKKLSMISILEMG